MLRTLYNPLIFEKDNVYYKLYSTLYSALSFNSSLHIAKTNNLINIVLDFIQCIVLIESVHCNCMITKSKSSFCALI
jgi:hypothetical protein